MTEHKWIRDQFTRALENGRLGHAYLFSGDAGAGKFALALELAQMHLCTDENKPCRECENCRLIKKYNNPRFQYLFPLRLNEKQRKTDDITQDGWEYIYEKTMERIQNPNEIITDYFAPIYVSRIRSMNEVILNGRGNKTATIIDGIDTLSDISLNTMLKTLEEPPEGALIILLARSQVLPTIRSRCIAYKLSMQEELSENIGTAQELAAEFVEIIFGTSTDLEKIIHLEKFIFEKLERNFDLAGQILVYLLSQIRAEFLISTGFTHAKKKIHIPEFRIFEQANLCAKAIDDSMLSIKKSSPLLMVFADLTIKLTEIFDERKNEMVFL